MGMPKASKPTQEEAKAVAKSLQVGGGSNRPVEGVEKNPETVAERKDRREDTIKDLERFVYNKDPRCLFTLDALLNMKTCFLIGGTDAEACRYAGVLPNAYYVWRKNMPPELREEWDEKIIKWKDENIIKARFLISQQIGEDVNLSKWYLERKRKEEFAPQAQMEIKQVDKFTSLDDDLLESMITSIKDTKDDEQGDN